MTNPLINEKGVHAVTKERLTAAEILRRQIATAEKSPEHLKLWLRESGHEWLIMRTPDLVDAIPFPGGVETVMMLVSTYNNHRRSIDSGRREIQKEPVTGKNVEVPIFKTENLEEDELDRCIRYLTRKMYEINPDWSLENAPL